jgi:hypothetical protein
MFLLLLCLGTILALTYPASCQPSCSSPPSSGSIRAALFHPFSRSTTAPTPSLSESGRETRWSPSAAFRPARQRCHAWVPGPPPRVVTLSCIQGPLLFTTLFGPGQGYPPPPRVVTLSCIRGPLLFTTLLGLGQ